MIYSCCDELRREAVRQHPTLNGIDFLDVIDHDLTSTNPLRQRTVLLHLLKPVPIGWAAGNVRISGGERILDIGIMWAAAANGLGPMPSDPGEAEVFAILQALADPGHVLVVRTSVAGDFSPYTLRVATSALDDALPANFDPQLASLGFSFKVECPTDFDCQAQGSCTPAAPDEPDIDYLAKDYASFRRLLLERLARLVPDWQQNSAADTGIAMAELIAYAADQLSYQQDAVATEAYLETARSRISLRRHALLVDYPMHDGCNARAWLQLQVTGTVGLPRTGIQFLTRCANTPVVIAADSLALQNALLQNPVVFEPLQTATAYAAHNQMSFYTWSDTRCCLAKGSTSATLTGHFPDLHQYDCLLFEEVLGEQSGHSGDADATRRCIVRLSVEPILGSDPYNNQDVTTITWGADDATPFPLCLSTILENDGIAQPLTGITVARGNLLLADHGQTIAKETLPAVLEPIIFLEQAPPDSCSPAVSLPVPPRFRPSLANAPVTQAAVIPLGNSPAPFDPQAAASSVFDWTMDQVVPQLTVWDDAAPPTAWSPQRTLLGSDASSHDMVVEVDDAGVALLRFGDDEHGQRPLSGTVFSAGYRIGNGTAGNIGVETIQHVVGDPSVLAQITQVRNPLPASGGVDAESCESVRTNAPQAFRTQERAVTTNDYALITQRVAGVARAAATMRWTGSWYTAFLTIEPQIGQNAGALQAAVLPYVDRYRMAGQDVDCDLPHYVSLEIGMHVCVAADFFRSDVKAQLLDVFSNGLQANGRPGLFHPDNFGFGQTVYLSPLYAAAHAIPGVASVRISIFQRQGTFSLAYLAAGEMSLGRLEIARLDNDANYPEHGVLTLDVQGGK